MKNNLIKTAGLFFMMAITWCPVHPGNFSFEFTVYAGSDRTVCENSPIQLSGSASGYADLIWTTSGDGTFSYAGILNPVYEPGNLDIQNGGAELCLTATDPSNQQITDCLTLTVRHLPTVDAGEDTAICENELYTTTATAENFNSLMWTTSGSGFFADESELIAQYYPSPEDLMLGEVELCLAANAVSPCQGVYTDCMILSFDEQPVVFAGFNTSVCETETYQLNESIAANYSTLEWITSGDGTFDDPGILHPVYTPGETDIAEEGVVLELIAYPMNACTLSESDAMFLLIIPGPAIELDSLKPLDCQYYDTENDTWLPVDVCADVSNAQSVQWTTDGDGTFDDPTSPCTFYHVGPLDKWATEVHLTLEAFGEDYCPGPVSEEMTLMVPSQILSIEKQPSLHWYGISSYLDLSDQSMEEIFAPVTLPHGTGVVEFVKDITGLIFWPRFPGPSINQLGNWEPIGYKARITGDFCLPLYGPPLSDRTFEVLHGINYLPVLTNVPVDIYDLLGDHTNEVMVIFDMENGKLWTPTANNFTILKPGKTYFLNNVGEAFTVEFPPLEGVPPEMYAKFPRNKQNSTRQTGPLQTTIYKSHWNDIAPRVNTAIYYLNSPEVAGIQTTPGTDSIGVFTQSGHCAGTQLYTSDSIAFGAEDLNYWLFPGYPGLVPGEPIQLRYYKPESKREFIINYLYTDFFYPEIQEDTVALFTFETFGEFTDFSYRNEVQRINIPAGWSGMSSFLHPVNPLLDSVFSGTGCGMEMLFNSDGICQPAQNINTIGLWDTLSGYAVKFNQPMELQIVGDMSGKIITTEPGWSMIPVLSHSPVQVEDISAQMGGQLVMIKEIAGWRVFWPEKNISSLQSLEPGKAYYFLTNEAVSFSF
ncbi:MAG: hypothetical protein ACLFPE_01400 [Bacteroidales bacterium]